jgi:hypothetical protein
MRLAAPDAPMGYNPFTITASREVAANRWAYRVAKDAREAFNACEESPCGGYAGVSRVLPIPNGSPVMAYATLRDGAAVLLFHERNEPVVE